mgnify:CR=1 FL=1
MTVSVNITSIPSRFEHLQALVDNLKTHEVIDEIFIHIPKQYTVKKFDQKPLELRGATVNYVDEDFGPCRRYIYANGDDVIIIVDDDTWYHPEISKVLVNKHKSDGNIWGGSGFNFKKYFLKDFSKVNNEEVQVVEGFGMIVLNRKILDTVLSDVKRYALDFSTSDDILMNNLYDKYGFKRFHYCEPHWIKQLQYGFTPDALHMQNDGNHMDKYKKSLKKLKELGEMHYKPIVSYSITVCNEHNELDILLNTLIDEIVHSDDICILVDSSKVTPQVNEVIEKHKQYINKVLRTPFRGDFAHFKNTINTFARGEFIFQLDADEVPTGTLLEKVYVLTHADLVFIPRVNIMLGMSESHMKLHGFQLNDAGFINFPDYQGRFYKSSLRWVGQVHERIDGAQRVSQVPSDPKLALWHIKTAQKSKQQRELYQKLASGTHE